MRRRHRSPSISRLRLQSCLGLTAMCAFCRQLVQTLVQTAKRSNHRCPLHLARLLPFAFHPREGEPAAIPLLRPRPTASDRCTCSWSSRSWNGASRPVPSEAIPRLCSTACRRYDEGHERLPFGRVRPACRSSTCPATCALREIDGTNENGWKPQRAAGIHASTSRRIHSPSRGAHCRPLDPRLASLRSGVVVIPENPVTRALT